MKNFDDAMELIGQGIEQLNLDNEATQNVNKLLDSIEEGYVIVQWPESQLLMEEDWFEEEAILDTESKFGSSAYFVPIKRVI